MSLLCLFPVPHLEAEAQRAPVPVALIVLWLRHHLRAAHSHLRMLWAQIQAVQPAHHVLHHQNCLRWSALSTPCSQVPEIGKAILWQGVKWTTWETNSSGLPYWSKLPCSHRTNQGLSQHLQLQMCHFPHIPKDVQVLGSNKQVQAENANTLYKSSDSETDRLQDIQEEPCRHIGPSHVKELAKFFTPTSDEEENSRVNNRTRCKKLFEPKKEEGSEK